MSSNAPLAKMGVLFGLEDGQFQKGLKSVDKTLGRFAYKTKKHGETLTRNISLPLAGLIGVAGKFSLDFESSFTGVRKTVNATEDELADLRKGILDMSKVMPTSANNIASVAESAGQLGIQTPAILGFTKTMVMLGDTTDIVADQAAANAAKIANIMDTPQTQFSNMGSTIVDLGNNYATTESQILDMTLRVAAAGKISKMAQSDIFAISTALSSVGVNAESGGTAAQKGILAINDAVASGGKELDIFASTSGMTASEFSKAWKEDSGKAFAAFINGLGKSGDNATTILSEVGLNSERTRTAFLSLANAGDLINRTLDTGRTAWKENIALTKEAELRYGTGASKIEVFKNKLFSVGVTIGDIVIPPFLELLDNADLLFEGFEKLSLGSQKLIVKAAGIAIALGPTLIIVAKLASALRILTGGKLLASLGLLTNPITLTITAVAGLAFAIYKYWDEITHLFSSEGPAFLDPVRRAFASLVRFAKSKFEILKTISQTALTLLAGFWDKFGVHIVQGFKTVFVTIGSILSIGLETLSTLLDIWSGRWLTDWDGFLTDAESSFSNTFGKDGYLSKMAKSWWDSFVNNDPLVKAGNWISSLFGIENGALQTAGKEAKEESQQTADSITSIFQGLSDKLKNIDLSLPSLFGGGEDVKPIDIESLAAPNIKLGNYEIPPLDLSKYKVSVKEFESVNDQNNEKFKKYSEDLANNIAPMIGLALGDIAGSFIESTAALAISGGSMKTVFYGVMSSLADLAIRVGKIAIGVGIAIEGIKKALQTLNPFAAIAGGIALVALGSIAKSALAKAAESSSDSKNQSRNNIPSFANGGIVSGRVLAEVGEYAGARHNPEVIAPLDKLKGLIGGSGQEQLQPIVINMDGRQVYKGLVKVENRIRR